VAELLLANHAEVDAKAHNGTTPLYSAAHNGHRDVAELLLANHADVDAKADDGTTPLYAATSNGHKDMADLLLANKADPGQISAPLTPPVLLKEVKPHYPEAARRAKVQGHVFLSLVVDTAGHPTDIKVLQSVGYGLDEEAVKSVQHWTFKPAIRNG
jgi:TonB family protein